MYMYNVVAWVCLMNWLPSEGDVEEDRGNIIA